MYRPTLIRSKGCLSLRKAGGTHNGFSSVCGGGGLWATATCGKDGVSHATPGSRAAPGLLEAAARYSPGATLHPASRLLTVSLLELSACWAHGSGSTIAVGSTAPPEVWGPLSRRRVLPSHEPHMGAHAPPWPLHQQ